MESKKIAGLLTGVIFLFIGGWMLWHVNIDTVENNITPEEIALEKNKESSRMDEELSELLEILKEKTPHDALAQLREDIKDDDTLARVCHDLAHELGHAAYEKFASFGEAMRYQDEICNSGYLHGIIESHFTSTEDIAIALKTVCRDYQTGSFIAWECYHGIGHGLMFYTENDLPRSLDFCNAYTDLFERGSCINGVFMENFNVDQKTHFSKYIKDDNSFYPCTHQEERYKSDCYMYAPILFLSRHRNDYKGASAWCEKAEVDYILTCLQGVGSQATKENINNPKIVEEFCMQEIGQKRKEACIEGMVGLYINHHGALAPVTSFCDTLHSSNISTCQKVIASMEDMFWTE